MYSRKLPLLPSVVQPVKDEGGKEESFCHWFDPNPACLPASSMLGWYGVYGCLSVSAQRLT